MTRCTCFTDVRCAIHSPDPAKPKFGERRSGLARERKSPTIERVDAPLTRAEVKAEYDGAAFRRAVIAEYGPIDWLAQNAIPATDRQRELVADAVRYAQRATLQGCHIIPKRWLHDNYSRFTTDKTVVELWSDARNGVPGSPDLHDLFDRGILHVPAGRLPAAVFDFERELGGPTYIDEYYGRRRGPIGVVK